MPIVYQDIVRGSPRDALSVPSPREDVLRETFAQAFEENPIKAVQRWRELKEAEREGPMLSADVARTKLKEAGMERDLTVSDAGITQAALDTLMWRKKIERRRQETFARSEGGFVEGAQRLGIAIGTTLVDPISMGLNFVPIVGQARYARWLSRAPTLAGRLAVRGGAGAIEGTVGAAIAEVPIYQMRTQEQADYDTADSLMNVAFGGVIGAGLHTTVGTAGELIARRLPTREPAPRIEPTIGEPSARSAEALPADVQRAVFETSRMADVVESLPAEVRQAALRAAVGQAVEGRAIDVQPIVQAAQEQAARLSTRENLPSSEYLVGPDTPPKQIMDQFSRVEEVPLESARRTQSRMGGESPGALIAGYADKPVAVRLENGEYLVFDGHHRAVAAKQRGDKLMEMHVVDAKQYAPALAGRNRAPTSPTKDEDLLRALGVDAGKVGVPKVDERPRGADEYQAAAEHAEKTLARDVEPSVEANLEAAEGEASLATAAAKGLADRLGVKFDDPDINAVNEAIEKAERWARAAELATVCLVRGG